MASEASGSRDSRGYLKIKEIGQGSYGKAVLVKDPEGKMYVIKVIDMSRMDSKQRKDAVNEVKVLSSLKHPYIISYRESFTEHRSLSIVMDYAEGGDLHQRIKRHSINNRSFPEERIARWFTEATLAMKYLHDKHVLHRDFKTQNLFLTAQDRLRLGDFGISKVLESTGAFAKTTIGTPYYLSPEICMERPYSYSSDIWALGCVLYEMAALRVPFDAQNLQALVQKITRGPTPTIDRTYSVELRQLCTDLLHREEGQRPSAQDILQRTIIQNEIRRMLSDEKNKDAGAKAPADDSSSSVAQRKVCNLPQKSSSVGSTASEDSRDKENHVSGNAMGGCVAGGTPKNRQQVSAVAPPLPNGFAPRQMPPRVGMPLQKTPSIGSDAGSEDGVSSARLRAAPLKGVGVSLCMENGGARVRDPSPLGSGRSSRPDSGRGPPRLPPPDSGGMAGMPSRHGTPAGLRRLY